MNEPLKIDTFLLSFCGRQVTITVDMMATIVAGEGVETYPIFYEGILLDYDNDYYYLGRTPQEVTQAVKKDTVAHIMVTEERDIFKQILEELPEPEKDEIN